MNELNEGAFFQRLFDQMMDLWVRPEVERRRDRGDIEGKFSLLQAQVVFYPDERGVEVRLNDEVRISVIVNSKGDIFPSLCDEIDANAGHMTLMPKSSGWGISFDFIYNRAHANKHLELAEEFLAVAKYALRHELFGSLVENLFAACELSAKSILLAHPDKALQGKIRHGMISARYNMQAKLGNVEQAHSAALNKLASLRSKARYLNGEHGLNPERGAELLEVVREMIVQARHYYGQVTE